MRNVRIVAAALALALVSAACLGSQRPATDYDPGGPATYDPINDVTPPINVQPTPAAQTPAAGNGGGVDASFGIGGIRQTDMGGTDDTSRAVVVTPDSSIIVAGEARADASSLVSFALARYSPGGRLDPTFGTNGMVFTPFGEFSGSGADAVALQGDGKIVVVGHAANPDAHHETFALARYNPDGSLDDTFGTGGQVITAISPETGAGPADLAHAVAIDAQGRIVVAGETGGFMHDFAAARYLPDGTLDDTFGNAGTLITDLGGDDRAQSIAIQPDGKILVGGSGWVDSGAEEFALVRYLDDGTLDDTFGEDGIVVTDFRGGDDTGQEVLLRPNGRILLAGTIQLSGGCTSATCERYGFGAAQYNADGTTDSAFGTEGKVELDFITSSGAYAAVLLADGTVALVGHIGNEDFGLSFVDEAGTPILVEGEGEGSVATRIDFAGGPDRAFGAGLGPDNAVVLVGDASDADGNFDFGLARYMGPTTE